MSKTYRAKVRIDLKGASKARFRTILDAASSNLLGHADTAGTLIFGSENDRRIDLIMTVNAGSSSTAQSRFDTYLRRMIYAIDPHSGVRTERRSTPPKAQDASIRDGITTQLELVGA